MSRDWQFSHRIEIQWQVHFFFQMLEKGFGMHLSQDQRDKGSCQVTRSNLSQTSCVKLHVSETGVKTEVKNGGGGCWP